MVFEATPACSRASNPRRTTVPSRLRASAGRNLDRRHRALTSRLSRGPREHARRRLAVDRRDDLRRRRLGSRAACPPTTGSPRTSGSRSSSVSCPNVPSYASIDLRRRRSRETLRPDRQRQTRVVLYEVRLVRESTLGFQSDLPHVRRLLLEVHLLYPERLGLEPP